MKSPFKMTARSWGPWSSLSGVGLVIVSTGRWMHLVKVLDFTVDPPLVQFERRFLGGLAGFNRAFYWGLARCGELHDYRRFLAANN